MRELSLVTLFLGGLIGLGLTSSHLAQHMGAIETSWLAMIALGAGAVVCECIYFAGLFVGLRRAGALPAGWYSRSFEHHHLLPRRWRWAVLPFFYAGFLGLLGALGIALVLGAAGLQTL